MENWFNIIGWLLSIATIAGNGFVIILVAKNRRLQSPANWFVLSLEVADFGVGIISINHKTYTCTTRTILIDSIPSGFPKINLVY